MILSVHPPFCLYLSYYWGFPGSSAGKESTCKAEDPGLILGSGRSPGEGIGYPLQYSWASLVAQMVNNPLAMQETWVGKSPWRRAWQLTPVFLPGESPWTEEPVGLQSMGLQRVRHDWATCKGSDATERLSTSTNYDQISLSNSCQALKLRKNFFPKTGFLSLGFTFCTYKFSNVCKGRKTVTKRET